MKTTIIIGGGAAGLFAASVASKKGNKIILIEKNNKIGKKLYITGKGRCNLTNNCDVENLLTNTATNSNFLYSAFYSFNSQDTINYFENLGVKTKVERGSRVYPVSEKASDIVKVLEKDLIKNDVEIILNEEVREILVKNNRISGVITNKNEFNCDNLIIATGGLAYPLTGSTGDGYNFAEKCGHVVTNLYPSLVPLKTKEEYTKLLEGLSLKNIKINVLVNEKIIFEDFGEMMFTSVGVTGPVILSASRYITKEISIKNKIILKIDLKPALLEKDLDDRILKDFKKISNKMFKNSLENLLPQKLIPIFVEISKINPDKKINEITKEERKNLVDLFKNFKFTIIDTTGFKEAVITLGGIKTSEINPKTMESKIVKGLFFAGEIIDVDAFTGGFNLQIAFSTAFLAGNSV